MDLELLQELRAIIDERRKIIQEFKERVVGDSIQTNILNDAEKAVDSLEAVIKDYERRA